MVNVWTVPPEPVNTYPDAAAQATKKFLCYASPFFAGLALRTPQTALFAIPFLLYPALQCGSDDTDPIPRRPFVGGQCPVVYNVQVEGRWTRGDGLTQADESAATQYLGPIRRLFLDPRPHGTGGSTSLAIVLEDGNGVLHDQMNVISTEGGEGENVVKWDFFQFKILERADGFPDTCGDPPPYTPAPYEDTGPAENPPIVFPPTGGPVYVDVNVNNTTLAFPITIAPVYINPTLNIPVTINIDGRDWDLFPDGELQPRRPGDDGSNPDYQPDLDNINNKVNQLATAIQDVFALVQLNNQELYRDVGAILRGGQCGSGTPQELEVTGNGFAFLALALANESGLRSRETLSLCTDDSSSVPDVSRVEINSGTSGVNHSEYVQIGDEVKSVILVCQGNPPGLRVYKNSGPLMRARFGEISAAIDIEGNPCPMAAELVFTREHILEMPPHDEKDRYVLLSLTEGLSWTLFDSGVR